jgi:hypothetical protein
VSAIKLSDFGDILKTRKSFSDDKVLLRTTGIEIAPKFLGHLSDHRLCSRRSVLVF